MFLLETTSTNLISTLIGEAWVLQKQVIPDVFGRNNQHKFNKHS